MSTPLERINDERIIVVGAFASNKRQAVILLDIDDREYQVIFFEGVNNWLSEADYFTSDLQDAVATAKRTVNDE